MLEDIEDLLITKDVMASGEISVLPVVVRTYAIEIQGLSDEEKESDAETALKDYFDEKYPFISGIDNENLRTDRVTKADILKTVYDAIYPASVTDVVITAGGSPVIDEYLPEGTIGEAEVTFG
jgi:hypothetical protein